MGTIKHGTGFVMFAIVVFFAVNALAADDVICVGEECEGEGEWTMVECENPAGSCEYSVQGFSCTCADGTGVASESGPSSSGNDSGELVVDQEPMPAAGEDLDESCIEVLVDTCGTEAPNIEDYCSEDQVATCTALAAKVANCDMGQGDMDSPVSVDNDDGSNSSEARPSALTAKSDVLETGELIVCCMMMEIAKDSEGLLDCFEGIDEGDCEAAEACQKEFLEVMENQEENDSDGEGDDSTNGEGGEEESASDDTSSDSDDTGCSVISLASGNHFSLITSVLSIIW
jgi:hypothetical protein